MDIQYINHMCISSFFACCFIFLLGCQSVFECSKFNENRFEKHFLADRTFRARIKYQLYRETDAMGQGLHCEAVSEACFFFFYLSNINLKHSDLNFCFKILSIKWIVGNTLQLGTWNYFFVISSYSACV